MAANMTGGIAATKARKKVVIKPNECNRYEVTGTGVQGEIFVNKDLDTMETTSNTLTLTVSKVADS